MIGTGARCTYRKRQKIKRHGKNSMPFRVVYRGTQTHSFGWVVAFSKPLRTVPVDQILLLGPGTGVFLSLSTKFQMVFNSLNILTIVSSKKFFHKNFKINPVAKIPFTQLPKTLRDIQKFQAFFSSPRRPPADTQNVSDLPRRRPRPIHTFFIFQEVTG